MQQTDMMQTIVFGGGCFWCTEAVFKMLEGVTSVEPGYAGGTTTDPSYYKIMGGSTGHAEVTKVTYNPKRIKFTDLLTVFFATHDGTSLDRQGADTGPEYKSLVLYNTDSQKAETEEYIKELNSSSPDGKPIVTEVRPLDAFYPAEGEHKDYYDKYKGTNPYCEIVIEPKLKVVQERFAQLLKVSN